MTDKLYENDILLGSENKCNAMPLEPEEIPDYLEKLRFRLGGISGICNEPSRYGFSVPFEQVLDTRQDFGQFVENVREYLRILSLKYLMQHKGNNPTSLTIDPTDSGFPHLTDLWQVMKDRDEAEEIIRAMPPYARIIEDARKEIYRGRFPHREQLLKVRHDYYTAIREAALLKEFDIFPPVLLGKNRDERLYRLQWYLFHPRLNVFLFSTLLVTQDMTRPPLEENSHGQLHRSIKNSSFSDLLSTISYIDTIPEIHPKLIIRYTLGPYYFERTVNPKAIDEVLSIEKDSFILKFSVESISSVGTLRTESSFKKFIFSLLNVDHQDEIFGETLRQNYMLVPVRLKQELVDHDERGEPCTVFGFCSTGEIVS